MSSFRDEAELQSYLAELRAKEEARKKAAIAKLEEERKAQLAAAREKARSTGVLTGTAAPGSAVTVENRKTGFKRELVADNQGNYRLPDLPAGKYRVTTSGKTRTVKVRAEASAASLDVVAVAGAQAVMEPKAYRDGGDEDNITNVQTQGVDEGGIVKKAGDYLVVLRRGRLFTIRANARSLQPVSAINAYGPDLPPAEWYDELLISGNTVIVIGFSYDRSSTEVGLFRLGKDGSLAYQSTYQLFSNDYYSSRNYASRLVGNILLFYSPIDFLQRDASSFPGVRRWDGNHPKAGFRRIVPAERIYRSGLGEDSMRQTLHTVTRCELRDHAMDCHASSVMGPSGSAFYVSRDAVYVWMIREWWDRVDGPLPSTGRVSASSVVRMPLDESAPTALRVEGAPIDQLSFLEQDGFLNVLVGSESEGLRMWSAEGNSGSIALLRVSLDEFGGKDAWSRPEHYRALPFPRGSGYWGMQNRYVGDWLLYGGYDDSADAHALRYAVFGPVATLAMGHGVERIEAMGSDAVIVGSSKGDLQVTSVALETSARLATRFVLPGARQGESRTHGFFYRPQGKRAGVFGLPVVAEDEASIRFLRNDQLRLRDAGALSSAPSKAGRGDDGCAASCVDWYGDARPIFIGDRAYGLLGYELVEGRIEGNRVRELRRVDFQPPPPADAAAAGQQ